MFVQLMFFRVFCTQILNNMCDTGRRQCYRFMLVEVQYVTCDVSHIISMFDIYTFSLFDTTTTTTTSLAVHSNVHIDDSTSECNWLCQTEQMSEY